MKSSFDQLKEKAINTLKVYEESFPDSEGVMEHLVEVCKEMDEINPFWQYLGVANLFKAVAFPDVQKAMRKVLSKQQINDSVILLDKLMMFFLSLRGEKMEAVLQRADLEIYSLPNDEHSIRFLEYIIEEAERKTKSAKPKVLKAA